MTHRPFCYALAVAACLLFAVPAWGAEEEPAPSSTPAAGQADARALVDAGRFAEALALLRPRLDSDVIEGNDLFLYGMAATGASQRPDVADDVREALLDEAIGAFHVMLVDDPGLVRVRLELARAFYLKGEDDLARRHFEAVLAGNVPEAVAANVRDFLNQIRARKRGASPSAPRLRPTATSAPAPTSGSSTSSAFPSGGTRRS